MLSIISTTGQNIYKVTFVKTKSIQTYKYMSSSKSVGEAYPTPHASIIDLICKNTFISTFSILSTHSMDYSGISPTTLLAWHLLLFISHIHGHENHASYLPTGKTTLKSIVQLPYPSLNYSLTLPLL